MAIGDEEPELIDILDWDELYAHEDDHDETIIPGLAYRGRWTAINAGAKAGKSTVIVGLAVAIAQKQDIHILYLDAEMGRTDMLDRVSEWMQLQPKHLTNIHYTDLPPKLDTVQGAYRLGVTIEHYKPDLVIIDGLNGVIQGAENDDTPWRDLYEWAIAPCKALNLAVISADNTGHGDHKRPRGHSVKLDKADAVINLERTDDGIKLTTTHRRTAVYPLEQYYRVTDPSPDGPPMTVTLVGGGRPEGTSDVIVLLDRLGAPTNIGTRATRRLVREAGWQARNETIDAARKERLHRIDPLCPEVPGAHLADLSEVCPEGVPRLHETPACDRGVPKGHHGVAEPAGTTPKSTGYDPTIWPDETPAF